MKPANLLLLLVLSLLIVIILSCTRNEYSGEWRKIFPRLGSGSSPKCTDLNNDGILDIVIGAGENEFKQSDSAVLALDGKTGDVLWVVGARDQIVGSATFLDVTGDGIDDVFIGGRSAEYLCINGNTGEVIWRFRKSDENEIMRCCFRFNFVNAQFISDVDADSLPDLLISNGGNAAARPFSKVGRMPGVLAIMSSKTGQVIVADTMPDGNETYMTPVVHDFLGNGQPDILIGTGGETLGGHLYRIGLNDLLDGKIDEPFVISSKEKFGFMAPPTLADINNDQIYDVIINWFGGMMMAFNGNTDSLLWETFVAKTESYSTPVPGYFNGDKIPDFFSFFNKGAWPKNIGSLQLMVDGSTGVVLFKDSLGCMGYSSPVTFDANNDGFDEVLYSANSYYCDAPAIAGDDIINAKHSLNVFDFRNKQKKVIGEEVKAKNISSTPWLGDMDDDGYMDIVYCLQRNQYKVDNYDGISIERVSTNIPSNQVRWHSYLGESSACIFAGK